MTDKITEIPEDDFLANVKACPLKSDPSEPECEACQ